MPKARVLIVEDDPDIRELLAASLAQEGWTLDFADSGEAGLDLVERERPDCVVLDIMLPGVDGIEVLRRIKAEPSRRRLPVVMTTARGEDADVVAGLELGADDYVIKPYSPKVLAARIRAALRRSAELAEQAASGSTKVERGGLVVDSARHDATYEGRRIDLSATEFAILDFLIRSPGWVFSRSQIIDAVRGRDYPVTDRSVDVQILSLRKKLGPGGELIETVRGVGYRLRDGA